MERPVHFAVVLLGTAAGSVLLAAEPANAPPRPRAVSPHVAEVLTEVASRQSAAPSTGGVPPMERPRLPPEARDVPANGIVRLPEYLVREPRLPSREEVMSRHSLEQLAMQKYLGDETGLERVLNMFSPVNLWRKIPGFGKFPFKIGQFSGPGSGPARGEYTNEDRAMAMYEADRMRERWENLMSLLSPEERLRALNPEAPPSRPVPLK